MTAATKIGRIRAGFRQDGAEVYVPCRLQHTETICPACEGMGDRWYVDAVGGFERRSYGTCDDCEGHGSTFTKQEDE